MGFSMWLRSINGVEYKINDEFIGCRMTREEAVAIVRKIGNDKPWYEAEIDTLEALGLLKFEEEKELSDDVEICLRTNVKNTAVYSTLGAMKEALIYHGYEIIRKGK